MKSFTLPITLIILLMFAQTVLAYRPNGALPPVILPEIGPGTVFEVVSNLINILSNVSGIPISDIFPGGQLPKVPVGGGDTGDLSAVLPQVLVMLFGQIKVLIGQLMILVPRQQ